jgi:hypothetical protein
MHCRCERRVLCKKGAVEPRFALVASTCILGCGLRLTHVYVQSSSEDEAVHRFATQMNPRMTFRHAWFALLLLSLVTGCSHKAQESERSLDGLLKAHHIDRIGFANEVEVNGGTNLISGDLAKSLLDFLEATNRCSPKPIGSRFDRGLLYLYANNSLTGVVHFSDSGVFRFGFYEFRMRNTNIIAHFKFQPGNN